jgi:hypothetical protein
MSLANEARGSQHTHTISARLEDITAATVRPNKSESSIVFETNNDTLCHFYSLSALVSFFRYSAVLRERLLSQNVNVLGLNSPGATVGHYLERNAPSWLQAMCDRFAADIEIINGRS